MYLECKIKANPEIYKIQWRHNVRLRFLTWWCIRERAEWCNFGAGSLTKGSSNWHGERIYARNEDQRHPHHHHHPRHPLLYTIHGEYLHVAKNDVISAPVFEWWLMIQWWFKLWNQYSGPTLKLIELSRSGTTSMANGLQTLVHLESSLNIK